MATVKALAHGSGKPCIPVDALEALAWSTGRAEEKILICPIQDARAGQVYGACFRAGETDGGQALKLEDFLAEASGRMARPWLFTGDGAACAPGEHPRLMGDRARFAGSPFRLPAAFRRGGAGAAGKGTTVDYLGLKETYLRPPNAEKNRKLLEAMRHE